MRRMENGQAALAAGLHCQAAARWRVEGGDTAPATVTHTFDWKYDCSLIPASLITLCANGSGAPGVFQLLPGSQEPDSHNKIVYSRSAEAGPESDVILVLEAVAVFISSPLTSNCYFHLVSGPLKSVSPQYMTITMSQYKPRL